jgi:Ca2+-binding RTX toxin-like protein
MVVHDNSVNNINIDNSVSNVVDNSDNSVNDFSNTTIQDSFNSIVDNSVNHFQLSSYNVSLDGMISGDRARGREAVRGTQDDDVIEAGPGKDRLIGRRGADSFVFNDADGCGRRQADQIRDFRPRQGDRILLDSDEFGGDGNVAVAENRRDFRQLKREGDVDFLYYQPKGNLYYNENGSEDGFGEGGLLAALKGSPTLTAEQINLI